MKTFISKIRYWFVVIFLAITTFVTSAFAQANPIVQMNHPVQCFPKEVSMQILKKDYTKLMEISGDKNIKYEVWGDGKTKETLIFLVPKVAGGTVPDIMCILGDGTLTEVFGKQLDTKGNL